jgi:ferredoxin
MARIRIANRPAEGGRPPELEASPAVSILNSLLVAGVRIRHDCGGKALCGTCALRVIEGDRGISPIGSREAERLAAGGRPEGYRLACQAYAMGDVEIELLMDS